MAVEFKLDSAGRYAVQDDMYLDLSSLCCVYSFIGYYCCRRLHDEPNGTTTPELLLLKVEARSLSVGRLSNRRGHSAALALVVFVSGLYNFLFRAPS